MSRTRITDFAGKYRENVLRQQSAALGRGNGESVKPALEPPCRTYGCTAPHPTPVVIGTWFRTGAQGTQIFAVEVVAQGKGWLDVVQEGTGATQRVRTDGEAEFYWPTFDAADAAIYQRLHVELNTTARLIQNWDATREARRRAALA